MRRVGLLILAVLAMPAVSQDSNGSVKTYTSETTIPTYPWRGKDDINPSFRWTSAPMYSPHTTTYPYPMQDNLAKAKSDQTYKTLVLENEYLKVIVIPELGGHVHTIVDKITGQSMLYENKVIKPSLIGLRGAWTSGGIEFNTGPQGHTVTCLSPVEAKPLDFADGSKGIAIGNVEQVYHTQWVVVLRLRPGRSFLEERIRIYNPTRNRHLYYFWNCVAMPNTPGTQFIYPMTLGTDHDGKIFFNWPVHEGKDISWLKNFEKPTSVFSYRCDQDFYGSYDHDLDRGVIAHANHFELIGKKSWTWSMSTWGQRAQDALTDDGSLYNEIQTGPLPTQADYGLLEPHQTVEWEEWWRPVRGTKGVAFSTKDVSANVKTDGGNVTVLIHGSGSWDATCSIEGLGEQPVKITPDKSVSVSFPCKDASKPLHIKIAKGQDVLAQFTHPLPLPKRTAPENPRVLPTADTAAGCWLRGINHDKGGGQHLARDMYDEALKRDPQFAPALASLGELDVEAGRYEEARKNLEKSLKLNPDDGMATYYLAQALWELGLSGDAMEVVSVSARRPESACASYNLAGAILLSKGEFAKAADVLRKALDHNAQDLASRNMLAYALLRTGNREGATHELADVQRRDPLDMPSAILFGLMGKEDKEFTERIAGRKEEVMDAADFFVRSGLKDEAVGVLERYYLNVEKKEPEPMAYYWHGVLSGNKRSLEQAAAMNPDYCFPSRRTDFAILEQAVKQNPKDWKAKYLLGNLCFERCRKDDAVKLWKEARALDASYSVLHRNLGLVAWKVEKKNWDAIEHYEAAHQCNANDFAIYRDLGTLYIDTNQYAKARDLLVKAREKKCVRADVVTLLGKAYLAMGEFEKGIELMLADSYTNWEGQFSLNAIWSALKIGQGEKLLRNGDAKAALKEFQAALEAPKSLGAGQMVDAPAAEEYYWIGKAHEALGNKDEARKAWKRASEETKKGTEQNKKFARAAEELLKEGK